MSGITILDEIVGSKRAQLDDQKSAMSLDSFRNQLKPATRDFTAALRSPQPGFILECKKASPSRGLIRADFDLASIANLYGRYASAISVLTESEYFQGSPANLGIVKQHTDRPLLCKDFIVDPYQVYQARYFGADAILLILAILKDHEWRELSQIAKKLGMAVLTEVSNAIEQARAIQLGAEIVGINNRNLRDMSVNLQTTIELAAGLPAETLVVSESGYATHRQVRRMAKYANAFLIGSSLMARNDLAAAVKSMVFGHCKVCGLTSSTDARNAAGLGATYGGVILAEGSPRWVSPSDVNGVFEDVDLKRVGVFQDQPVEFILNVAKDCRLDVIQLHGEETMEFASGLLSRREFGFEVWKAMSVTEVQEQGERWLTTGINRMLVDNQTANQKGGTGERFDWSLLPEQHRDHIMLAGGIGPDNVADAMELGCAGVDLNSGVELSPGIKSLEKLEAAFQAIRNY